MKKCCCVLLTICLLLVQGVLPALATEEAKLYPYEFAFEAFWYEEATPPLPSKAVSRGKAVC